MVNYPITLGYWIIVHVQLFFFQPYFPYVRSLLGTARLLLWTNFLSCTFILNCTINHSEHFFSNCLNNNNKKNIKFLIICEVPHNLKENDIHYLVMILKSVSRGYHFNIGTLPFPYWTSTIKCASSSNRVKRCINWSLITST